MYPLYSFKHNIVEVLTLQTWLFLFMDPKKGRVLIKMNIKTHIKCLNGPDDNVPSSNTSHYNKGHESVSGDEIIQCVNLCVRFTRFARKHSRLCGL